MSRKNAYFGLAAAIVFWSSIAAADPKQEFVVSVKGDHLAFPMGSQVTVSIALFPIKLGAPLPNRPGHLKKGYSNPTATFVACGSDSATLPSLYFPTGSSSTPWCASDALLAKEANVAVEGLASGQTPTFTFTKTLSLPSLTGNTAPFSHVWVLAVIEAGYQPEGVITPMRAWLRLTEHCEGGGKGPTSKVDCAYWTDGAWALHKVGSTVTTPTPPHP
jgi:hypothetical protein